MHPLGLPIRAGGVRATRRGRRGAPTGESAPEKTCRSFRVKRQGWCGQSAHSGRGRVLLGMVTQSRFPAAVSFAEAESAREAGGHSPISWMCGPGPESLMVQGGGFFSTHEKRPVGHEHFSRVHDIERVQRLLYPPHRVKSSFPRFPLEKG